MHGKYNYRMIKSKVRAGILGATGAVGQRFIMLLENHPWIEVTALGASERSANKRYAQAVNWRISSDVPSYVHDLPVFDCSHLESFMGHVDFVFSGLDSSIAGVVEESFAAAGIAVFSNAKNHRMHPNIPILIPCINPDHLDIVKSQSYFKMTDGKGFIVTNANCSSTGLSIALKPLHDSIGQGISMMFATTLQAVSGAGYPGLPSIDCIDNIIPFINGEEEKVETEPSKILGKLSADGDRIEHAKITSTAICHRVPVSDGHTVSLSLKFNMSKNTNESNSSFSSIPTSQEEKHKILVRAIEVLDSYSPSAVVQALPSCPSRVIVVRSEEDRPQPRLDRMEGYGMSVVIGRVRTCSLMDLKLTVLSHNTIIGAAGGSLLNAELAIAKNLVKRNDFQ